MHNRRHMAGKENFVDNGIDNGLTAWQKWNKGELVVEAAGLGVGLVLGAPAITAVAATFGAVNLVQMGAIHTVQEMRASPKSGEHKAAPHPKDVEMQPGRSYFLPRRRPQSTNALRKAA